MDVAQLISAADSPASSPRGSPTRHQAAQETADAVSVGAHSEWATKLSDLKMRFVDLQHKVLALATSYEDAAEQLQFETKCQQVLVDKYAEIRARRMQMFLRVPESGMMVFVEESKRSARKLQPEASRRELRSQLAKQWELLSEGEQEVWNAKFRALHVPQAKIDEQHPSLATVVKKQLSPMANSSTGPKKSGVKSANSVHPAGTSASAPRAPAKRKNSLSGGSAAPAAAAKVSSSGADDGVKEPKPKKRKPAAAAPASGSEPMQSVSISASTSTADPETSSSSAALPIVAKKKRASPSKKKAPDTPAAVNEDGEKAKEKSVKAPSKAKKSPPAPRTPKASNSAKKNTPSKKTGSAAEAALSSPNSSESAPLSTPVSLSSAKKPKKKSTPTPKTKPKERSSPSKAATGSGGRLGTPRAKKLFGARGKKAAALKKQRDRNGDDNDEDDDNDDDEDDDDDNDNDNDNEDESMSSAGGSASDEDSDEHMAQLPTGAFG